MEDAIVPHAQIGWIEPVTAALHAGIDLQELRQHLEHFGNNVRRTFEWLSEHNDRAAQDYVNWLRESGEMRHIANRANTEHELHRIHSGQVSAHSSTGQTSNTSPTPMRQINGEIEAQGAHLVS